MREKAERIEVIEHTVGYSSSFDAPHLGAAVPYTQTCARTGEDHKMTEAVEPWCRDDAE